MYKFVFYAIILKWIALFGETNRFSGNRILTGGKNYLVRRSKFVFWNV